MRLGLLLALVVVSAQAFHAPLPLSQPQRATSRASICSAPRMTLSAASARPALAKRFVQHKQEALTFYRFLSIVYDTIVNPGHWTEEMRDEALEPAKVEWHDLDTVDVGAGTGFCTLGIVKAGVRPEKITMIDQSPHQLAKAKKKEQLKGVTILEGDAEDLPFETDSKDRYVSAGSIEYWPEPQRGICEAYRVLKPGGLACVIGPVYPTNPISRFFADAWMLFPTEKEYIDWFTAAGFKDVQLKRIGPWWYHGVRRHGLIMGCSVTARKAAIGESPLQLGPKEEDVTKPSVGAAARLTRLILGTAAGFYYFCVPVYMLLKHLLIWPLSLVWKGAHKRLM